jgi:hypothetical protein
MKKLEAEENQKDYISKQINKSVEIQMMKTDLKTLERSMKYVHMVRNGSYGDEWYKYIDKEDMKILYKQDGGAGLYTFYLEKVVKAPLFDLLSVVAEVQTYKDWVPLMYKSEFFNEVSHFRKMVEVQVTLPWPFYNRSVYVGVGAMPIEEEEAICVTLITKNSWLKGMDVKKDDKLAECEIKFMTAYIKTISENE